MPERIKHLSRARGESSAICSRVASATRIRSTCRRLREWKARLFWRDTLEPERTCKFLRSEFEIRAAISFIRRAGYVEHDCQPKNWDLAHVLPAVSGGPFLDMGCWNSFVLRSLASRGYPNQLYGVDLQEPTERLKGVTYVVGDLTQTGLPAQHFSTISCLSVIEHGVDFGLFAREVSRLLRPDGKLFVTFDYWEPAVAPAIDLYGLPWRPLDSAGLQRLLQSCAENDLHLEQDMDWRLGKPLIRDGYHSPDPSISYTFGLITLIKRKAARTAFGASTTEMERD